MINSAPSMDELFPSAINQYQKLLELNSSNPGSYDAMTLLQQEGVMALAARWAFRDLLYMEADLRRDELTMTSRVVCGVDIQTATPLIEAITGRHRVDPDIGGSSTDRDLCVRGLLALAPETAGIPGPDGRTPLELAVLQLDEIWVDILLGHPIDVNGGRNTALFLARMEEGSLRPTSAHAAEKISAMLVQAGGILRRHERSILHGQFFGRPLYKRPDPHPTAD